MGDQDGCPSCQPNGDRPSPTTNPPQRPRLAEDDGHAGGFPA